MNVLRDEYAQQDIHFNIGVYPNTFESIDTHSVWCAHQTSTQLETEDAHGVLVRQHVSDTQWEDYVHQWLDKNVNIVGGCCGMDAYTMQTVYSYLN
ncbi:MAG TPA: hypothetical protein EYO58_10245 [Flavobacteriales bacterium]|nr:hypothetical protein [Flavobacteriales bacterium]